MILDKFKLFWKSENNHKYVHLIKWEEKDIEYYSFIKKQYEAGYHQVSLTSELMLNFIKGISAEQNVELKRIEFMEDDIDEREYVDQLIDSIRLNRGNYVKLLDTLKCLEDESSVEILRLNIVENRNMLFCQVNGLLGLSSLEMKVVSILTKCVEENIN